MTIRIRSWLKKKRKPLMIVGIVVLLVGIILGYWFKWDWTGFSEHIGSNIQQYQAAKTLWDWLQLLGALAIPVVVGLGTVWFTTKQGQVSDAENKDNQRENALQVYIDKMSELLLKENLRESKADEEVRTIARVRTLTVLSRLDSTRKKNIVQFLHESKLISKNNCIVAIAGADLTKTDLIDMNLQHADFHNTNLSNSDFTETNLRDSDLRWAILTRAIFVKADLWKADLFRANLREANLRDADLGIADLKLADLRGADLRGADLRGADLRGADLGIAGEKEFSDAINLYNGNIDIDE